VIGDALMRALIRIHVRVRREIYSIAIGLSYDPSGYDAAIAGNSPRNDPFCQTLFGRDAL
jgi:hypothetical protein